MKRQALTPVSASIRLFRTTAASSLMSQRTLQTLTFTTPLWRATRGSRSRGATRREGGAEVAAGRGRCPEAPRSAAAPAATSHTVPPTPRCPTSLSAAARVATTSASPPGTPTTPSAARKPKVLLWEATASSPLPQPAAFRRGLPPRPSAPPAAQKGSKRWPCQAARSSLTLKGLMTVLERMSYCPLQRVGSRGASSSLSTPRTTLIMQKQVTIKASISALTAFLF